MQDDLTLIAGPPGKERRLSGWTSVRVSRGIERCPSDFDIGMTERYPGEVDGVLVSPGDPCRVLIGNDLVITGYVDRFIPSITAGQHSIRVTGRGKCQDLVDCSAEWPSGQISGSTVLGIAQKLAQPYANGTLTVSGTGPEIGPPIQQFNIIWGETAYELIERVCRYRALLAYEGVDGNLILSRVGTARAASGFSQGINVEHASIAYSMDQRFSDYVARILSVSLFDDTGSGGDIQGRAFDKGVPRHRLKYIVTESAIPGLNIAQLRADWEAATRFGRSMQLTLATDSWRDSAGTLWTPNTLVPLHLPALKLPDATWLIGEVTFERNERGTHAKLTIMPPEAFAVQPPQPLPFNDVPPAAQLAAGVAPL